MIRLLKQKQQAYRQGCLLSTYGRASVPSYSASLDEDQFNTGSMSINKIPQQRHVPPVSVKPSYKPRKHSEPYVILLALAKDCAEGVQQDPHGIGLTKRQILDIGRASFRTDFEEGQTTWAAMRSLVDKGLVCVQGTPSRYSLTQEGRSTALSLCSPRLASSRPLESSETDDVADHTISYHRPASSLQQARQMAVEIGHADLRRHTDPMATATEPGLVKSKGIQQAERLNSAASYPLQHCNGLQEVGHINRPVSTASHVSRSPLIPLR
jgi:hypothetical protein